MPPVGRQVKMFRKELGSTASCAAMLCPDAGLQLRKSEASSCRTMSPSASTNEIRVLNPELPDEPLNARFKASTCAEI